MSVFDDMQACKAEASRSGTFDRGAYDSCMIRKGFQQTGTTSFSRTTGISPAVATAIIGAAVPVLGRVAPTVENVAGQIGAKPGGVVPSTKATPGPSAPSAAPQAPAPSVGIDTNMLLLLGGVAILFLFARR